VAIKAIEDWLNNPVNYETGLKLLEDNGGAPFLLMMLREGVTAYNKKRLIEELREISRAVPDAPVPSEQKANRVIATDEEYRKMPEDVQTLVDRVKHLYKENGQRIGVLQGHKEKLKKLNFGDAEEYIRVNKTGVLVNIILDADDEIRSLLDRIDEYKSTGTLRVPKAMPQMTYNEAMDELRRLRSQISKQKHNAKRAAEVEGWRKRAGELERITRELV